MSSNSIKKLVKSEVQFNGKTISIETGKLALLAKASVLVKMGSTTVLVAVTSRKSNGNSDFLPLTIDFEERYYAGGQILGSKYTRREGKPNDMAIVNARLVDHAIRPLFPKDFCDEVQIVITVLSIDGESSPALLGFLGASAALEISDLPFHGPIISLNIEKIEDKIKCSLDEPSDDAKMSIHTSYTKNGELVQAIEAEAHIVKEADILEAINIGSKEIKPLFKLLEDFKNKIDAKESNYTPSWLSEEAKSEVRDYFIEKLQVIEDQGNPFERSDWHTYEDRCIKEIADKFAEKYDESKLKLLFSEIQKEFIRNTVLEKGKRVDGRKFDEIRMLSGEVGVIDRVHGSGLFNRGFTQALTLTTLASTTQSLMSQNMDGESEKTYFHHYNFPPYSTGEVGRVGGTNRRAIGHGLLAEKALVPVLPDKEKFPYVIRTVSEILGSNGSTSMASTCGSSLSLMDAGVPIKEHVAGIGVGLFVDDNIKEPKVEDFTVLTDILGHEDFSGYMDFKMTGTKDGVTAIQMELKLKGIPLKLLDIIFETSRVARLKVLDVMNSIISAPRDSISEYAPKLETVKIKKDEIGAMIGSGGANIKGLIEQFGVDISVDEKDGFGVVTISSTDQDAINRTKKYIQDMFKEVKVGEEYTGKVTRVEDYGAFIEILPKQEGLLHVSEYSHEFVSNIRDFLDIGDEVKVKVKGLENGKISLSRKALFPVPEGMENTEQSQQRPNNRFGDRRNDTRGRDFRGRSDNRNRRPFGNRDRGSRNTPPPFNGR